MREFLIIGGFGISLILGLASIRHLRIYLRTRLKRSLLLGGSDLLGALSFLVLTIRFISLNSSGEDFFSVDPILLLCLFMIVIGIIMNYSGFIISCTGEYSVWKEIYETTSFWQKLTGNVPIIKYDKPPPPAMSKRTGLILGISVMTFGSLIIILNILFKIPKLFIGFIIPAIFAFIFGLLLVIFSIIYLDKGKKSSE